MSGENRRTFDIAIPMSIDKDGFRRPEDDTYLVVPLDRWDEDRAPGAFACVGVDWAEQHMMAARDEHIAMTKRLVREECEEVDGLSPCKAQSFVAEVSQSAGKVEFWNGYQQGMRAVFDALRGIHERHARRMWAKHKKGGDA